MAEKTNVNRLDYISESGTAYTCTVRTNAGKKSQNWERKDFFRTIMLEDAVYVSLEKCKPLAKKYRLEEISDEGFMDEAKKLGIGEQNVIVFTLHGKINLSRVIKSAITRS